MKKGEKNHLLWVVLQQQQQSFYKDLNSRKIRTSSEKKCIAKICKYIVARKLGKGLKMLSLMSSILSNYKLTKAQGL
jgi:hypothetical protein